jgi:2,4-dienoyl-CoA reductase-like NADH-dependent reductase (Old Yellow Enzyme family)
MSVLFSPFQLRGLALPNRIMVAPMCQYSSVDGEANDWHFTHINSLALSGAAIFCIEATAVEAIGRITPGCLGLWNDATEAALKPILAAVRRHSKIAVAMQLAHAGRKASSHVPWNGGQLIPISEGGWQAQGPSDVPHKEGEAAPLALDARGLARVRDAFVATANRAERLGIDALELHCARAAGLLARAAARAEGFVRSHDLRRAVSGRRHCEERKRDWFGSSMFRARETNPQKQKQPGLATRPFKTLSR